MNLIHKRITINAEVCNGKPTIRGLKITVQTIVEFLLAGNSDAEILKQYPVLEQEDFNACKQFTIQLLESTFSTKVLADKLKKESKLVAEDSLEVLKDFEKLEEE